MTITVNGMRSNKPVSMDIDQIRGWATFMDRAVVMSLIATIIAVAALGTTTWLSFRFSGAVRAHEHAAFDQYKGEMGRHAVQLEQDVSTARERAMTLEQEVSTARGRTVELEQEISTARERTVEVEQEVSTARERAVALEKAADEAYARAARAARESATASEKARTPEIDAAAIQQRVAELGKMVREATARATDPAQGSAAETPRPAEGEGVPESAAASRDGQPSPIVASLRKYAGTKAALYVLDQASDAPAAGSTIFAYFSDAGWAPQIWTWTGVGGIVGVVVLIKESSDPATYEAASAIVDTLRSAGFNATKGDWPADWRRFRGTLNGPQTPGPTEAPIRIVIGAKAR
jgi:hypothetical protein